AAGRTSGSCCRAGCLHGVEGPLPVASRGTRCPAHRFAGQHPRQHGQQCLDSAWARLGRTRCQCHPRLAEHGRLVHAAAALLWRAAGLVDEKRIARSAVPSANSLVDNARLFALLNIAACDALIAGFDSKFAYNLWRPYHAIRLAATDGNADTTADPAWNSL